MRAEKRHGQTQKIWFFIGVFLIRIFFQTDLCAEQSLERLDLPDIPYLNVDGEYSLLGSFQRTGGSGDKTLLRRGKFLTNAVKITSDLSLLNEWSSHVQLNMRKTDNPQIDSRSDIHLLGLTAELSQPNFQAVFGDFYGDFSQYTLSQALEGAQIAVRSERFELKSVAARSQRAKEGENYARYVFGGESEILAVKESRYLKDFRLGFHFSAAEDDGSSIDNDTGIVNAANRVGSMSWRGTFFQNYELEGEFARSWTDPDTSEGTEEQRKIGPALRMDLRGAPNRKTKVHFNYEWVGANFEALPGSAVPDRVNFGGKLNYKWTQEWQSDFSYKTFYDQLEDSVLTKRTMTHSPVIGLDWMPYDPIGFLEDFFMRLYWDMRGRHSEDDSASSQIDFVSHEIALEDQFRIRKISFDQNLGFRYEEDDLTKTNTFTSFFGSLGLRSRREIAGFPMTPFLKYQMNYDDRFKEGGRDFIQSVNAGLDIELAEELRFEQRYGFQAARRLAQDSDSAQFNLYAALDYGIFKSKKYRIRLAYDGIFFLHGQSTQNFNEHKLESELLCRF